MLSRRQMIMGGTGVAVGGNEIFVSRVLRFERMAEDRNAGAIEQCFRTRLCAGREGGGGDDCGRFQPGEAVIDECQRGRVLEAGNEDRDRGHAALSDRVGQGIDGRDIGGKQHRTIEQNGDDGCVDV